MLYACWECRRKPGRERSRQGGELYEPKRPRASSPRKVSGPFKSGILPSRAIRNRLARAKSRVSTRDHRPGPPDRTQKASVVPTSKLASTALRSRSFLTRSRRRTFKGASPAQDYREAANGRADCSSLEASNPGMAEPFRPVRLLGVAVRGLGTVARPVLEVFIEPR